MMMKTQGSACVEFCQPIVPPFPFSSGQARPRDGDVSLSEGPVCSMAAEITQAAFIARFVEAAVLRRGDDLSAAAAATPADPAHREKRGPGASAT